MKYIEIKDAKNIVNNSTYVVKNPESKRNNWNKVFNNNNPINIELGMGRGDFIIEMAKTYPKMNFIGIEINDSQMVSAINNLKNIDLSNLKLINMDAMQIDKVFGKEINTIYLTFSEPWPKKHDEKRRFTHISYLKLYDKIFKKNKHIILKTDNKGLFAYSLETLSQYWYTFEKLSLDLHHDERNIPNIMTNYEKQYFKEGRPIYYVDARFDN